MSEPKPAKKVSVTAYPYATQFGEIEVPADLEGESLRKHIVSHWNEICFKAPDLDYVGTDFDIYE